MDLSLLWHGVSPRQRAVQLFSDLRVWDTDANNGVLVYLLLADRSVEIVADRGIDRFAGKAEWDRICGLMEHSFRQGKFEDGLRLGVTEITRHLERHCPRSEEDINELPDAPLVI